MFVVLSRLGASFSPDEAPAYPVFVSTTVLAMKREEARAIYHAGEDPAVDKLCELSAELEALAKEIASLKKNSSNSSVLSRSLSEIPLTSSLASCD